MKRYLKAIATHARSDSSTGRALESSIYWTKVGLSFLISDWHYSRMYFRYHMGRFPDLDNPTTFNEKLQWLRLNYRPKQLIQLVDKFAVREFVQERVGESVLIPVYDVYNSIEEISLDRLPDSFVLKPTHGSGWISICRDKANYDWARHRARLKRWMKRNYYYHHREWAYRFVPRRIICEKLLLDESGEVPNDFKFFCFNGEPEFVQVDVDRFHNHSRDIYDLNWNRLNVSYRYPQSSASVPVPPMLGEMVKIARKLAAGFPFCRVDLYTVSDDIFFGELTFLPENGIGKFSPLEYDCVLGEKLRLPR